MTSIYKVIGVIDRALPDEQLVREPSWKPEWYPKDFSPTYTLPNRSYIKINNPKLSLFRDHHMYLSVRELATAEYWFLPPYSLVVWYYSQGISYAGRVINESKWRELVSYMVGLTDNCWINFVREVLER